MMVSEVRSRRINRSHANGVKLKAAHTQDLLCELLPVCSPGDREPQLDLVVGQVSPSHAFRLIPPSPLK